MSAYKTLSTTKFNSREMEAHDFHQPKGSIDREKV